MSTIEKRQGQYKRLQNAMMNDPILRMAPNFQTATVIMKVLHNGGKKWSDTPLCGLIETGYKSGIIEKVYLIYREISNPSVLDATLDPNLKPFKEKTIDLRELGVENDE